MKKKILALAFVALMTLGLAKPANSETWECITVMEKCGPSGGFIAMICGDGETAEEIFIEQQDMLSIWFRIHGC